MEIDTERRFPHYAPHDDHEQSTGPILTFLSGAHRDISIGHQQRFEFSQSWRVTVPAAAAANVLHVTITSGANDSGNIQWQFKQDDALEAEAASKALEHARQIATRMAGGLGVKLGPLVYASNQTPPRGLFANLGFGQMSLETQNASVGVGKRNLAPLAISPERISKSATVYAVFAIE